MDPVNKNCTKCGGAGWVWWYELNEYFEDRSGLIVDDTKYPCDECEEQLIEQLEEYAELEGSEAGEYWSALCNLAGYAYCMPDDFAKAVLEQVRLEVENIEKTMEIVEEERTYTTKTKELRDKC